MRNHYVEAIMTALFESRYPAIAEDEQAPKFYVETEAGEEDSICVYIGFKHAGKKVSRHGVGIYVTAVVNFSESFTDVIDRAVAELVRFGSSHLYMANREAIVSNGKTVEQDLNP